ncbi:low molecular weight phosphatase family protein [Dactylosporangium sp. NPDC006015]|uniref:arsenate reductase/protein-tyrosine-phosphatase family protein n=1 Tax=Dactylosporangium sp. NPDC006015 TaxID=3154576 RepID=UPI0033ABE748
MNTSITATARQFRILYVCVGNLCRSVLAEHLTQRAITEWPPALSHRFHVHSAGTRGRDRQPMHPYTAQVLTARGASPAAFTTSRLTAVAIRGADLVLTATVRERDDVLALHPAAVRRTFTINEFARLAPPDGGGAHEADPDLPEDPVALARQRVAAAVRRRGRTRCATGSSVAPDDIPDPDRTLDAFDDCATAIDRAVQVILHALSGPR